MGVGFLRFGWWALTGALAMVMVLPTPGISSTDGEFHILSRS
jgi:hypothetical protein